MDGQGDSGSLCPEKLIRKLTLRETKPRVAMDQKLMLRATNLKVCVLKGESES